MTPGQRCGTDAGYHAHRRADTEPCDRCRTAHASANRASRTWRAEQGPRAVRLPADLFAQLYLAAHPSAQLAAEEKLGVRAIDQMIEAHDRNRSS